MKNVEELKEELKKFESELVVATEEVKSKSSSSKTLEKDVSCFLLLVWSLESNIKTACY